MIAKTKKMIFAILLVALVMSSGCTDSSASGEPGGKPPSDGNMSRPERPEGAPDMPGFEEPTDVDIEEVTSVFMSQDPESITSYCSENSRLCMYYCMRVNPDDTSCQSVMESGRPEMPDMINE